VTAHRVIRELFAAETGAAVIELALVAPMLALMTVGVVDMSNAYSRKLALEQGTQRAIEKIMQTTELETVEDTLKNEVVCQVNGTNQNGSCKTSPITTSNVTVTYRLDCTDTSGAITSQTNTDAATFDSYTCSSGAKASRYIEVAATDKYAPLFVKVFAGVNSDGTYHISAKAGMRTE
jgi:Flp pilus assembly protein TadG